VPGWSGTTTQCPMGVLRSILLPRQFQRDAGSLQIALNPLLLRYCRRWLATMQARDFVGPAAMVQRWGIAISSGGRNAAPQLNAHFSLKFRSLRALLPLSDDLTLMESGSTLFALRLSSRASSSMVGVDPFSAAEEVYFPVTIGDFIKLYESA
jgi:hypothetical protein